RRGTELADQLARQSITLLANDGTLPLSPKIRRVAIVGPHADGTAFAFPPYTYAASLPTPGARFRGQPDTLAGTRNIPAAVPDEAVTALVEAVASPLEKPIDDYVRDSYGARSLAEAVRRRVPDAEVIVVTGCGVADEEPADIPAALAA